jgi:hypothetical protein
MSKLTNESSTDVGSQQTLILQSTDQVECKNRFEWANRSQVTNLKEAAKTFKVGVNTDYLSKEDCLNLTLALNKFLVSGLAGRSLKTVHNGTATLEEFNRLKAYGEIKNLYVELEHLSQENALLLSKVFDTHRFSALPEIQPLILPHFSQQLTLQPVCNVVAMRNVQPQEQQRGGNFSQQLTLQPDCNVVVARNVQPQRCGNFNGGFKQKQRSRSQSRPKPQKNSGYRY